MCNITLHYAYMYTDVAGNGSALDELAVFEENYALLCNMIADIIDPLIKYCVKENLLTTEEETQIITCTAVIEKLQQLLLKISSCLKAGNTRSFHMMLAIMREQGGKGTQTLSDHIMNRLKISTDQLSHVCTVDTHVQNDEPKGLLVYWHFCVFKLHVHSYIIIIILYRIAGYFRGGKFS